MGLWMRPSFIGEAPGFHEDQQGIPFVGAAGKLLNELLEKAGISRNTVYISNVIKCRPPGNREPQPDEVTACGPYLDQQIDIIKPKVIVTLGRYSMARAFPEEKISVVHGHHVKSGHTYFPMYHPALHCTNQVCAALSSRFYRQANCWMGILS